MSARRNEPLRLTRPSLQPPKQPDQPQFLELPWLDEDGKSQFGVDAAMILPHDWLLPRLPNLNKLR